MTDIIYTFYRPLTHYFCFQYRLLSANNYYKALEDKKWTVAKFYLESGHKLDCWTDMGESLLDPMFGNDAPVELFDLFLEKGGCTLSEMPAFPKDQPMMGDQMPKFTPCFSAAMVNSEKYVKHIFGKLKAAGASVETLNPTCEVGDMGKKTLLEFTTMMVEEFLPQMEGDPDAPPDFADKAKAILVFLKAELE